ncbi:sugar ABC transporter permease [Paenibacillus macerans]|nr:sugar ABC transporter permease [Paenibacillus macerans]
MDDTHETRSIRTDLSGIVVKLVGYVFIGLFSLFCLLPFLLVLGTSFTAEAAIKKYGFNFWPREFSTFSYKIVFENPGLIVGSYLVTIGITVVGTAVGLFLVAMTGYALQRPDSSTAIKFLFHIFYDTVFRRVGAVLSACDAVPEFKRQLSGGAAAGAAQPVSDHHDESFVRSIPHAITESAKIDGAGDFTIFVRLILPMTTPALATIGLFIALGYWNEWYNSMLFLSPDVKYRPLQLFLYNVITSADFIRNSAAASNVELRDVPLESMKMATAIVATGPVILFYPFVQRYFIKGITVGAVKG